MKELIIKRENKGITLVALVVTIVVLLILAGVSIVTLFGESGIITAAQKTKNLTEAGVENDLSDLEELEKDLKRSLGEVSVEVKLADGTEVELTKENYGQYLGKVVTNYTGATSVTIGEKSYTVSPTYRLYYVDFDGKYGEKGSIYLKADYVKDFKCLELDETSEDDANIKIKQLNPGLYKDASGNKITSPTATNENIQAVIWLTNTINWDELKPEKTEVNKEIVEKINYIVGAPSLEMMMDSYNAHYGLTGDTPDTTTTLQGTTNRVKLFYKYPYNTNNYGYGVGPSNNSSAVNGYYTFTSDYSVKTDSSIDSMYYPGDVSSMKYFLASPSAYDKSVIMTMNSDGNGRIGHSSYKMFLSLCPLVSLKPSAQLELGE